MISKELYLVPIRIESEANLKEHWAKRNCRHNRHKSAIRFIMYHSKIKPPCEVILTRIAPRMLDAEDNLPTALKSYKDIVADLLIPDLAPGRADGCNMIKWEFRQTKGKPKEYVLKIELTKICGANIIDRCADY